MTLEDILEHLFEEAYGDDTPANCGCDIIDEMTMIAPGIMSMEQVNDLLQASLPLEEFDTIEVLYCIYSAGCRSAEK